MLMKIMPQPSVDTLYHYNTASNKLEGRFTVKYPSNDKIPWHAYYEIPKYFIGDVSFPIQIDESTFSGSKPAYYMVDKKHCMAIMCGFTTILSVPRVRRSILRSTMDIMSLIWSLWH